MNNFTNRKIIEEIVNKHINMVTKIAFQYVCNQSDAEDIMQDVFVKLIEYQKDFKNEEHLKAWLIRVTINMCINYLKSSWYKKRVPYEDNLYEMPYEQKNILEELFSIPYKYRIVIYLYYYEEYTMQEIADILGKSINTISSQLQRARKKLRIVIEERS